MTFLGRGRRPGLRLVLAVVVIGLAVTIGHAGPAIGQSNPVVPVSGNDVRLVNQTSWVADGDTFRLQAAVTTPDPRAARLQMTVYQPVVSRADFTASLSDRIRTGKLKVFDPVPVAGPGSSSGLSFTVNPKGAVTTRGSQSLRVTTAGIYPIRLDLVDTSGVLLDRMDTHMVFLGSQPSTLSRLDVALVLPVHARPAATGSATLADLTASLAAHSAVPLTVVPTPQTIETLANGTGTERAAVAQLAQVLAGSSFQTVASPYVRLDLPAMLNAGLDSELNQQLAEGTSVLNADLRVTPDPGVWVETGSLSAASVDNLAGRGVRRLIVRDDALAPLAAEQLKFTPTQTFAVGARNGRQVQAVSTDAALTAHFASTADPVLAGHQLLADLALIQGELPQKRGRGVAVVAPGDWRPDASFVTAVVEGIGSAPMLAPVTASKLFSDVTPLQSRQATVVRAIAVPQPNGQIIGDGAAIRAARRSATSLSQMLPADGSTLDEIERTLLVAESADLADQARPAVVERTNRLVDQIKGMVKLPGNRSITFTARQGRIPITILSSAAFPVRVSVRVSSQKLAFQPIAIPGADCVRSGTGEVCTLTLRNQDTTLQVPVLARTAGVFSLAVSLDSPDGSFTLASNVDTVRSTAASGVGIILSIGAIMLLAVWWARDVRHGRRARQLVPAPVGPGGGESERERLFQPAPRHRPERGADSRRAGPAPSEPGPAPDPEPGVAADATAGPSADSGLDLAPEVDLLDLWLADLGRPDGAGAGRPGPPPAAEARGGKWPAASGPGGPGHSSVITEPVPVVPSHQAAPPARPTAQGSKPRAPGQQAAGSFSRQTKIMAGGTLLSRITGFGRVLALVWAFHLSGLADVYNIANTVPNILYDLVLGGVLSATLVPVFVDHLNRDDPDEGWRAVSAVVTAITMTLIALSTVFWLAAPAIIRLYLALNHAPTVADQAAVGTALLRLFVPQLFLLGGIAVTTALLNARRHFAAPAFSPVINNLIVMAAIVATRLIASDLGLSGFRHQRGALLVLGLGTTAGYLLQFLVQLPSLVRGRFHLRPVFDMSHPAVRTVLRLSLWTFGSVMANQIAFNLVLVLAERKTGDVTVFQTAYQFFQLPYAIFAVSIASVLTPELSDHWAKGDLGAFRGQMAAGLRLTLAILVPAAVGYVVLAHPFLQLVFHHGSFSVNDAQRIGTVVALFAVGLPGFSAYLLLMRAYQAMQDTRSMFWLYLIENLATVVLASALYPSMGVRGLALGWVSAYTLGSMVAFAHLRRRTRGLEGRATLSGMARVVAASAVMAVPLVAVTHLLNGRSDLALLAEVGGGAVVGAAVYLAASRALGITEVTSFLHRDRATAGP